MSKSHLINANIHRAKEGARVLEDIARFLLHDEISFLQIREIRHNIQNDVPVYDVKVDGGVSLIENNVRGDLLNIVQANALRLQEALRVLEEYSYTTINKQLIKKLRYQAYEVHSRLYHLTKKYLRLDLLEGLYLIVDTDIISDSIEKIIDVVNQTSIHIIQYRNKSASKKIIFDHAYRIKKQLNTNKLLIINDHIDIALDLGDGVHLGQNDYPLNRIRGIVPDHFIVGISCHTFQEAQIATQCGASYIAIGCLFETKSKHDITPVSLHEIKKICADIPVPVCAIGGINNDNLDLVLTADVKMAALISYPWKTINPLKTINDMHEKIIQKQPPIREDHLQQNVLMI